MAGRIPRLASHDSLHNRTVNLTGGHNTNLSWDFAVQLISRETRGEMREAEGEILTEEQEEIDFK